MAHYGTSGHFFGGRFSRDNNRSSKSKRQRSRSARRFEQLEPRLLLATFTPSKDNTLYENASGLTSNGAGQYLYAGMTNQNIDPRRRAVLAFDLTSIPAGSTVTAASLSLLVTRNPFQSLTMHDFSIHRLTSDWGEGTSSVTGAGGLGTLSTTGDATWAHTSFNTESWTTAGGDFVPTSSATTSAGNDGATATWSSVELLADVQAWVNSPADNFGWIIIGQEGSPKTARRFFSREGATPPVLDVTFTPPAPAPEVSLSVDRPAILENAGIATFIATLSAATTVPVVVDLGVAGTATAEDFTMSATQITIAPGETSGAVTVAAIQDALHEENEDVAITISSVTNGTLGDNVLASTFIIDDDPAPTVTLTVDSAAISEAAETAAVTASLSAPSALDVTIDLDISGSATEDVDYVLTTKRATLTDFTNADFATTTVFSSVEAFAFDLDLDVPLSAGSFVNPPINQIDYGVSGTLVEGTPSGFSSFALVRSLDGSEFYSQGSGLRFEVSPSADLSDGVQVSELSGPDPVFVLDAREVGTGRFHPPLLQLNSDGTGRIQNSNNAPTGTPIDLGVEYVTDLEFNPATLTIARPQIRIVVPAGSTEAIATIAAVQDSVDEADESVVIAISEVENGRLPSPQEVTVTIIDDELPLSFVVSSLNATDSGFRIDFNEQLDGRDLNLYDTLNAAMGAPDVVVTGASTGNIAGSLLIGESWIEFVKSGAALAPDTYTVTLRSAADGFKNDSGMLLDGDGDGAAGGDYSSSFTVAAAPQGSRFVSMPDFVRGPGQDVNVPADETSGIPISISDGVNVRAANIRISYDPALLSISGATAPGGGTVVVNTTTPGLAILDYSNTVSLPAGPSEFINLQATVPAGNASAIYQSQHLLDVREATVGDGNSVEFPVVIDDAYHFVTFFADVSGNGRINASDAAQVARFAALIDAGFAASLNSDPFVLGDISGNGRLNAADASRVARFAALFEVPEIPPIPAGVIVTGVIDLDVSIRQLAVEVPGRDGGLTTGSLGFVAYADTLVAAPAERNAAQRGWVLKDQSTSELLDDDLAAVLALDWIRLG